MSALWAVNLLYLMPRSAQVQLCESILFKVVLIR